MNEIKTENSVLEQRAERFLNMFSCALDYLRQTRHNHEFRKIH